MTSPTQRAGADVQRYYRGEYEMKAYGPDCDAWPQWLREQTTLWVDYADYAALQARIAELEARNAASERDAGRYAYLRDPPVQPFMPAWIAGRGNAYIEEDWLTGEQADAVIDAAIAKDPRKRLAIDAHAQGQAGEEK